MPGSVVIVGGTSGLGKEVARHYAASGHDVVISGRDAQRAQSVATELGGTVRGLGFDLRTPSQIAPALADLGSVRYLVLTAIERDENTVKDFSVERAMELMTMKLVGYAEVIHALADRFEDESAIVLFGGQARARPYPGSTTITTVNGAVTSMINTLAVELAPTRVNAIHPGIVADSPYWSDKSLDGIKARTPGGRLVTMADVVGAVAFLLENRGANAVNLVVDGGWTLL